MKPLTSLARSCLVAFLFLSSIGAQTRAQGLFTFVNPGAPTRLGLTNGPLAGPGYWGQAMVGLTTDSLSPLGAPVEHQPNGLVHGPVLLVAGSPFLSTVFVQMAAWDGGIWGTNYANVPMNQLGFTDIVPVQLTGGTLPAVWPLFTLSAIVPEIPEPSALALTILGGAALFMSMRHRQYHR